MSVVIEAVAEKVDNTRLGSIRRQFEGVIPEDWVLTTLGETFKWRSGGTPLRTNPLFYGGDIPWLIIGDLNDGLLTEAATSITEEGLASSATRWVEEGSVLLAMYGSIGKLGIAGKPLTTNQAIAFTKADPHDAKYLFYYLMYSRESLASLGKGATQKNISQAVIKEYPFPLAPLPEQRRIVAAIELQLGRLDAAVARLHAAKAKLKRYRQAVLNEMVHPQENVESFLLGDIVEKVQVGPFGSQLHKADYVTGGIPLINPQHISDQVITPDMNLTVGAKKFRELPNYHLKKGDVIVGRRGEMGRCAVITEKEDGWFCGTGSLYIRPTAALDPRYLAGFLASPTSVAYLQDASIGTTMSNLNKGILLDMPIDLPPLTEQRRLVGRIEQATAGANEMESTLDAQLAQSTRLRQSVLKRAFEGRLV